MYNLSESKFAVEESDVGSFVVSFLIGEISISIWEGFSEISGNCSSGFNCFKVVFLDFFKVEIINYESGWDDVILVDGLDESLDSGSFDELFFVNASLDCSWVSGDTDEGQVRESVFLQ